MTTSQIYAHDIESLPKGEQADAISRKVDALVQSFDSRRRSWRENLSVDKYRICRRLFDGEIDEEDYDYLSGSLQKEIKNEDGLDEIINMVMPGKVRHIPIVRPKVQALISKESSRPLVPRVYAVDEDSVNRKKQVRVQAVLDAQNKRIETQLGLSKALKETIALREQAIQMSQQQVQQGGQADPMLNSTIQDATAEIVSLKKLLQAHQHLSLEEQKNIYLQHEYSYRDHKEELCNTALNEYIEQHDLRRLFNRGIQEQFVTDEEIYYVDYDPSQTEPTVSLIMPENIWYPVSNNINAVEDVDMIVEYIPMTIPQVVNLFKELTAEELKTAIHFSKTGDGSSTSYNLFQNPYGDLVSNYLNRLNMDENAVDVYKCYWKERVTIYLLVEEEKKEDYQSAEFSVIDILSKEEADKLTKKYLKKNKYKIIKRFRNDLYQGYKIGESLYLRCGKCPFQYRKPNSMSDVCVPYIGYAVNDHEKPNSIFWETRELQDVYNVISYKEETLIALSGVKGDIMDESQLPVGMSFKEWLYHKKQGVKRIQTVMPDGPARTFNQFQTFDDTLSPSIQYLSLTKENIRNVISIVTGINDQEMGQISSSEQVGNTKIALQQGSIVTEYYMQRHDALKERVLGKLANLFPYAYKKGKQGAYLWGNRERIFNIPAGELDDCHFRSYVRNGEKERLMMSEIKERARVMLETSQIGVSAYMEIVDSDTISEIKKLVKGFEEEFNAKTEAMQQNAQEAQAQSEQRKQQHEQQMAQMSAQNAMALAKLNGQIEMQKAQLLAQNKIKADLDSAEKDSQKASMQEDTKRYGIDTERAIEESYLAFQQVELASQISLEQQRLKIENLRDNLGVIEKMRGHEVKLKVGQSKEKVKD